MLYSLKVSEVFYKWYQSESWTLGPNWAQINSAYFILRINYWVLVCDNRKQVQQSRYFKLCRMQMFNWPCSCAGEGGTSSQDHNKYGHYPPTSTLGQRHKCRGIWLFPLFSFEKIYERSMRLLHLYLNCMRKFLARYKSLSRQTHGRWRNSTRII